jgi:hypothetical protein
MTQRRLNDEAPMGAQAGGKTESHFVTVSTPPPHEGVGRALRSVYIVPTMSIPDDLARLMDRLDRL